MSEADCRTPEYQFTYLPSQAADASPTFLDKTTKENLVKWGMLGGLRHYRWSYSNKFEVYKAKAFFTDLINSQEAQQHIQVLPETATGGSSGRFQQLGALVKSSSSTLEVDVTELQATVTDLTFFDRLESKGLLSATGQFKYPNPYDLLPDDPTNIDLVRLMLMKGAGESDVYSDREAAELIFKLFGHLVLGGNICQHDDNLKPYKAAASALYGKLVTPFRSKADSTIVIKACIYSLDVRDSQNGLALIPSGHGRLGDGHVSSAATPASRSFTYAIVEPMKKEVIVLSYDRNASTLVTDNM